ncbi:hypothetical protein CLAVI_000096 [Candidatus Clavichlamydia salmonicola]|uniref:STAS domain-containing protein n=1 Tax=Candidatus Clavichlamydia salmonicola TaxID=469812 RepID=UPI001891BD2B|nr:STAS domain-containing protein [Candidatus Clavichlamydia salmonicola]MBF5050491.1 hypothetical protein [Candidatus Clavichlamydia salmonicola]
MKFQVEQRGDVLIVFLQERLDAATATMLEDQLSTLINNGSKKLLLNMQNTKYLSSAGVRGLLSVHRKMCHHEGLLILCELQEEVLDILRIAGFDNVLQICETEKVSFSYFL